mmetsp:Transcript_3163/g.7313  ORF Transcript_3163/g.7313 Transcript_3163/m.7313 type:complete len:188 (+) Transcript_3163:47-610(+)
MGAIASQFTAKHQQEHKILLVGLVGSGKTTMLHSLQAGEVCMDIPTIGFNVETLEIRGGMMNITSILAWDVGGPDRIRGLWRRYYADVDGLVFMADSSDRHRVDDAREQIQFILREEELLGKPLLVFANKQDLPNVMTVAELVDKLSLNQIGERRWFIQESVAMEGKGINDGLEWLSRQFDCNGSSG